MQAGTLDKRATLHNLPADTQTDFWCSFEHLSDKQHRVVLRHLDIDRTLFEQVEDDITPKLHITLEDGRVFDISDIDQDQKRNGLTILTVEERVNSSA